MTNQEPTEVAVEAIAQLAATAEGRRDLARMILDRDRELSLWRAVFGPETADTLAHLAACMYCVPICGHEEERCLDYDALAPTSAQILDGL